MAPRLREEEMAEDILIYDTTLRDGTQREGLSLSLNDKLAIARRLDEFGIHYIEGGWPGSNPKDAEFFSAEAYYVKASSAADCVVTLWMPGHRRCSVRRP